MQSKLLSNAVLNVGKTVLGILFPLITYPYVSRILGVSNLGKYNFSYSVVSYFLLIAGLGISTYGIREGIRIRDDKEKFQKFVNEMFSINLISTIISYMLMFVLLFFVPSMKNYRISIIILSGEIIFTTLGVSWICNIYEDFFAIAIRTIGMQVLSLVLTFLFIKSTADLYKYEVVLLISNSGANFVNFFYVRKKYCKFSTTLKIEWRKHIKPIFIIFFTTIAITVYVSSDITMLGFMTNDFQVGLYATAAKIYTIIKNVLAAILLVMVPRFTIMFSKGGKTEVSEFFSNVFNILTLLMLPVCVGVFSLSEDIVLLISGQDYIDASQPLKILSIAIAFSLYSHMYTQCVLVPIKEEKIVFRATLISAVSNIVLNFILIPIWGISAAAFTTIIAELVTFLITFYCSRKFVDLIGIGRNLSSVVLGCLCICIICHFCSRIPLLLPRVGCSIVGSAVAYFFVLFLMRNSVLFQWMRLFVKNK